MRAAADECVRVHVRAAHRRSRGCSGAPRVTNGQVERMHRTLKDASVRRYCYDTHDQLRARVQLFLDAYNHARRLETFRGLMPYEFICKAWANEPHRFTRDPTHDTLGPNI